ncbi:MAG TPA: von Willebrand factor type A domain-containing protein [Thermoanaerobaculia bacterium]|nr:von Willebrand factor type A domain-containing protein [Thermoanaerobaculia bacterium]
MTDRELEQRLASIETEARSKPPAELLAAIKSEIPEELPTHRSANQASVGGVAAGTGWWLRHRYAIAAALLVVAATGLLSVRLAHLASSDRLAPMAQDSTAGSTGEPSVEIERDRGNAQAKPEGGGAADLSAEPGPHRRQLDSPDQAPSRARALRTEREQRPDESGQRLGATDAGDEARESFSGGSLDAGDTAEARSPEPASPFERTADDRSPDALTDPSGRSASIVGNTAEDRDSRGDAQRARAAAVEEISVSSEAPRVDKRELQQGATTARQEQERSPTARSGRAATRTTTGEHGEMVAELKKQKEALESELQALQALQALGYVTSPEAAAGTATSADTSASPKPATEPAPAAASVRADSMASPAARDRLARGIAPRPTPPDLDASFDAMQFSPAPSNPFVDPAEDPLSTFGLDVDTGSYTLARRYLDLDRLPPSESVRLEEYVNFFDYGDPAPRRGDFAIRLEAGPSAFAPDGAERLVLRVGVRARDVEARDRKPAALIFLVDVSGSMQRENRLELVKRSLELLIDELGPEDSIGLVVYSSNARAVLEPTHDHDAIRQAIARLVPEGSTNLEDGFQIAYEMASRVGRRASSRELIRRVILCSDGVANVGVTDPESLLRGVADWAQQGVELTTVGFGMGNYNDELMERLADRGDGSYAYVDSLREARRIFVENLTGTLQTIAADARIQVEFDPEVVASYRLLGYANRAIPDAAFRDERVDAGEIGAGHRVSALYELELARGASRSDRLATVRLRWRSKESGRTEETEEMLREGDAARSWSSAPASLRLAQIVAGFAERLGRSPHTGATLDELFREGQAVLGEYPGRLDVARLVTEIGEARDLEVMAERERR